MLVAKKILKYSGLYNEGVEVISCPTCGRCDYDSITLANQVELLTANIKKPLKIAVMGCVVNGPGEAKDCDLGIAGSKEFCVIFKKGEIIKKVAFDKAQEEFIRIIKEIANEK